MSKRPLVQLVLFRIREFAREPEAVFWALLFPILLSVGLGVALASCQSAKTCGASSGLA